MAAFGRLSNIVITQDALNKMFGSASRGHFDAGLLPVFDPGAPTIRDQFIKAEDIYGQGAQGAGFLNIGPNALSFQGSVDPLLAGVGIQRDLAVDPFSGTIGGGGAIFTDPELAQTGFEEFRRNFKAQGFESAEAQQEAFTAAVEGGDAQTAALFFNQEQIAQQQQQGDLEAWEAAAQRLVDAGPDYYRSLLGIPEDSPAAQDAISGFEDIRATVEAGQGTITPRQGILGFGRAKVVGVGEFMQHTFSHLAPEDIGGLELQGDFDAFRQAAEAPQRQAPQAHIAFDNVGAPANPFQAAEPGFDEFFGVPTQMGFYGGY